MKRRGIAFKLTSLILCCAFITVAAIVGYTYNSSRKIILEQSAAQSRNMAREAVSRIDSTLAIVQKVADNIAFSLEDATLTRKGVLALSRRVLANNPEVFGMAIAFEPYHFQSDELFFAPYQFRSGGRISYTQLGNPQYRYFYMDWYQLPKELDRPVWTEPYMDTGGGNVIMATYSVPFYRTANGQREFVGVVTADISLDHLQKIVDDLQIFDTGYAFLLSRTGTYITHPDKSLIMNETIFSLAEEQKQPSLRAIGKSMVSGESAFTFLDNSSLGKDQYLYYTSLENGGWSLGMTFPEAEMLADVRSLSWTMVIIGSAGFLILAAIVIIIARRITDPLVVLSGAAMDIAAGNLELEVPEFSCNDEICDLASCFKIMSSSLKTHIANLTATTAAKERIESELRIARDIQMGILPKIFPAFPERDEFEVYASFEPAKEVGGDLYDFFFVDDDHFCFLVGDVSGKGVPAALFMAVTKTLLKVVTEKGLEPGEIITKVNDDLAADNPNCMFVTLFFAIINTKTGETRYTNAGHNLPVFIPSQGEPTWVPSCKEPFAGVMEMTEYSTSTMTFKPGDTLLIYTDGVTEAMNTKDELYSEDRLMDVVKSVENPEAQSIIAAVDKSIEDFAQGAEQSDDITILALQFFGEGRRK